MMYAGLLGQESGCSFTSFTTHQLRHAQQAPTTWLFCVVANGRLGRNSESLISRFCRSNCLVPTLPLLIQQKMQLIKKQARHMLYFASERVTMSVHQIFAQDLLPVMFLWLFPQSSLSQLQCAVLTLCSVGSSVGLHPPVSAVLLAGFGCSKA